MATFRALPGLLDKDLVVVTGKGGVGKSTVAAALGIAAAGLGKRTVVAEVGGRADTVPLLSGRGVEQVSITPGEAKDQYLHDQLPGPVAELLSRSGTFAAFVEATPGMAELLTIGKVWEMVRGHRRDAGADEYDLVILDAPASGHGLALLGAPRTFSDAARVGPIHRQAGTIHELLSDPQRTGVVAVTLAEEMPVNETLELRGALGERWAWPSTAWSPTASLPRPLHRRRGQDARGAGRPRAPRRPAPRAAPTARAARPARPAARLRAASTRPRCRAPVRGRARRRRDAALLGAAA